MIRAILRRACNEWEWIERVPKVKMFKEAEGRVRSLTPPEFKRLVHELPEHLADMAVFAVATVLGGMAIGLWAATFGIETGAARQVSTMLLVAGIADALVLLRWERLFGAGGTMVASSERARAIVVPRSGTDV